LIEERGRYDALVDEAKSISVKMVKADVDRTCPTLSFFQCGGRARLERILHAYVLYDRQEAERSGGALEPLGYVQGMNVLVTNLLWHSWDEESAFWLFVASVRHFDLRSIFQKDMSGLKMHGFVVLQLIHLSMADLSDHLADYMQGQLDLCLTEWIITLFASTVPLVPLANLWDNCFEDGWVAVYRLILTRLRLLKPQLMAESEFGRLVDLVKYCHVDVEEGLLASVVTPVGAFPQQPDAEGLSAELLDGGAGLSAPWSKRPSIARRAAGRWQRWFGRAPRRHGSRGGSFEGSSTEGPAATLCRGRWTCADCNGSESCVSWEAQVALVSLRRELIPARFVAECERMFHEQAIIEDAEDWEASDAQDAEGGQGQEPTASAAGPEPRDAAPRTLRPSASPVGLRHHGGRAAAEGRSLHVSSVPPSWTSKRVEDFFHHQGDVERVRLAPVKAGQESRVAVVDFATSGDALKAAKVCDGLNIDIQSGKFTLQCSIAQHSGERSSASQVDTRVHAELEVARTELQEHKLSSSAQLVRALEELAVAQSEACEARQELDACRAREKELRAAQAGATDMQRELGECREELAELRQMRSAVLREVLRTQKEPASTFRLMPRGATLPPPGII